MEGVVPFPADVAAHYRQKGYWDDRPLRTVFKDWCVRFDNKIALYDANQRITFRELD